LVPLPPPAQQQQQRQQTAARIAQVYYSEGHFEVTDVQTMCEQVIEGDPKQYNIIIICDKIASIKKGDELVGEYSKVQGEPAQVRGRSD
jgi:hypothetical protein